MHFANANTVTINKSQMYDPPPNIEMKLQARVPLDWQTVAIYPPLMPFVNAVRSRI